MEKEKIHMMVWKLRTACEREEVSFREVVEKLQSLLVFLCSPEGRTHQNCRFVDSYFMENDQWAERDLPDAVHDILADLSGALHDTISSPEVAENFDSTPEQLLERLRKYTQQDAPRNAASHPAC